MTGLDGSFVLRSCCAPREPWILTAGDRQRGFCLRTGLVPAEFSETPLRIEIDAPAFIAVQCLPAPPDASFRARVELAVADVNGKPTASVGRDDVPDALESQARFYAWPEKPDEPRWRLGPLPPGYAQRVTRSLWSPKLRFDITPFERKVCLRPGTAETVSLEAKPGMTLDGRITDTKNQPRWPMVASHAPITCW